MKNFYKIYFIIALSGCVTPEIGFVNYKRTGNVYTTIPQTTRYDEVGAIQTTSFGHIWDHCDNICFEAIQDLKTISEAHGGNSVINVSYRNQKRFPSKTPVCLIQWAWSLAYGVGLLTPWVKSCHVSGVATFTHE